MTHRVDVYTAEGMASGVLAGAEPVRDRLEIAGTLALSTVTWQDLTDLSARAIGDHAFAADDLVVVVDDASIPPVHAAWHTVRLEAGPYTIDGELPTLPGFDPGRALTRPSGEFVLLRDVRVTLRDRPELGTASSPHALVNRYAIDRVTADLMLGFYFPGAAMDASPAGTTAASA